MMTTAEEVESRAASYLEPISEAEPAGANAAYDPRYEALRNDMAGLDSPTGGEVDWSDIEKRGRELLTSVTKDLLVASYTGYALFETQKLSGLAVALRLLRDLFERYWDTCFPPVKRMRGRGNALDWFVARLEIGLPKLQIDASDRPDLDRVTQGWQQLGAVAREKLDEHCPSMRGVSETLERMSLTLPAPPAAPSTPAAPASPPNATNEPAAAAAAVADSRPNPAPATGPAAPAKAPSADTTAARSAPTPEPAPTAAEQAKAADDPLAAARTEAEPWLQPIDGGAGNDARYEPEYEEAHAEVSKLEALSGELPDWSVVAKKASAVLEGKAKDILMASYLAYARFQLDGLQALPVGLMVLHGVLDRFYDQAFPKRPRGRANAVAWLVGQLDVALSQIELRPDDRARVTNLDAATKQLVTILRDKMEADAPSTGDLTQRVQRMLLAVPEPEKEKPKPEPKPAQPQAPARPSAAPTPAPAPAPVQPMPEVGTDVSSAEEVVGFLQETGRALVKAANILRRAEASNAAAYRLLRAGLWLHLQGPPPAGPGGKTQIPPLPEARRKQFQLMAQNAKWAALLEETESSLTQFRFNLDLQRASCEALDKLGDDYAPARKAAVAELASLLGRMPQLPELVAADGSPLADDETKRWLRSDVLGGAEGAAVPAGEDEGDGDAFARIRGLMREGKASEAMKSAQSLMEGTGSARRRFGQRLTLAEACLEGGHAILARGMFAGLERELRERNLLEWEPALAGRCLEGFVRSIRAANKAGSKYDGADAIFERLCLVDPSAAARVSG